MDEWTALMLHEDKEDEPREQQQIPQGLTVDAATLQAEFDGLSSHLDEVRRRHVEVLVTAGMLPETGLAELHPDRALQWMVESINGRLDADGLSIPLFGVDYADITLHTKETPSHTLVQLTVDDGDSPTFVRELPLPLEAKQSLHAHFINGRLHLRW